jgi:hypothetical protein
MISDADLIDALKFLQRYAPKDFDGVLGAAIDSCGGIRQRRWLEEIRKLPTNRLELSIRSLSALTNLGLKTIGDVAQFVGSDDDKILARGKSVYFGKRCLREVRSLLEEINRGNPTSR